MSDVSTATAPASTAPAAPRPSVVQLAIKEKAALYASYMPYVENGGLFVPTTRAANIGDDIYLIVSLMDDPARDSVSSKVVWITPADVNGRQQGIGVQFNKGDVAEKVRAKIENLIGSALKAARPTHTL
jgi:type IV pilus assembly protein PilZ